MSEVDRALHVRRHSFLDGVCDALVAPRPLPLLLFASFCVSVVYVLWVFGGGLILGTSPFWQNPHGIVGRGWGDIFTNLSGYTYFQHDRWRLPLFHVANLGTPSGTNVFFTDSIPWLALAGRLVFQASGVSVNLFGFWTAFCFCASAMSLTALVAILGQRGLAPAAAATIAGLCMPALLARWGHTALLAHFEITLALIFYFRTCRSHSAWRVFLGAAALAMLTIWTTPYIFAMACSITLAGMAQAASNRTLRLRVAVAIVVGIAGLIVPILLISGIFESHGGLGAWGFGVYSMNMLSPFLPQRSGLVAPMRDLIVDATSGQYEGLSYLGGGTLLLLLASAPLQLRLALHGLRHHPWLFALFVGMTLFALSNMIYFGGVLVAHLPLPESCAPLAAIFRASGRWFWPVMYCVTALAIAAPIRWCGSRGVILLCLAIPLQWIDTAPLRHDVMASVRVPAAAPLAYGPWVAAMSRHRSISVFPQMACLDTSGGWNSRVAVQLQFLASIADRPINSVYARSFDADCAAGQRVDAPPAPGTQALYVFLNESKNFARLQTLARAGNNCLAWDRLVVCSDIPGEAATLAGSVTQ